jgi:predicted amidohydrolase YtcJ
LPSSKYAQESILLKNTHCVDFAARKLRLCTLFIERDKIKAKLLHHDQLPKGIPHINLQGQYVIPGFTDAHSHLISRGIEMQRLDLSSCRSLDECLQKISAYAKTSALVFASNWDENYWRHNEMEGLNRKTLDKISKKKPIVARRVCGHYAAANTAALRRIDKCWKIVDRRKGLLYEDVALNLNDIFRPTDKMLEKALTLATRKAINLGITSVHEISNPRRFRMLQKHRQYLKLRFAIYLIEKYHDSIVASGLRTGYGDDWLRFAGSKLFVDGSVGARTAALWRPYADTRRRGNILISARRLKRIVRSAEENGVQLMIHSIGDRSTRFVLEGLKKNLVRNNPLRHRIEHLELITDKDIRNMGRLRIIASMQPNFVRRWQYPGGLYEKLLGQRYLRMNCFKSLLDSQANVLFGSDCMPLGPLYGIGGAVRHPSICGRLDIADAFRLYTETASYATFEEARKGKIEPGYLADLVVLDKNPLEEKNLHNLKIVSVMVGGNFVKS